MVDADPERGPSCCYPLSVCCGLWFAVLLQIPQPLAQGRLYQRLAYGPGGVIAAAWEGTVQLLSATNGEMLDVSGNVWWCALGIVQMLC